MKTPARSPRGRPSPRPQWVTGFLRRGASTDRGYGAPKRCFSPGSGPTVVSIEGVLTALSICEDIWFEGTAAKARTAGARLIVNIKASLFHTGKGPEREAVLRRALREGGLPIVYLNLVGGQDELVFDGGSMAMDGTGRIARRAPEFAKGLFVVEMGTDLLPGEVSPVLAEEEAVYAALVLEGPRLCREERL